MPAVLIRQLEALTKIMDHTRSAEQRALLLEQAAMIRQASEDSVPERSDRADVEREYELVRAAAQRMGAVQPAASSAWTSTTRRS